MKYAVIRLQGQQFRVTEGQQILVGKLGDKALDPDILLVADKKVQVGTPKLTGAKIKLKVLKDEKGKKLYVQTYKAKARYRRKLGFRPQYTRILIEKIS